MQTVTVSFHCIVFYERFSTKHLIQLTTWLWILHEQSTHNPTTRNLLHTIIRNRCHSRLEHFIHCDSFSRNGFLGDSSYVTFSLYCELCYLRIIMFICSYHTAETSALLLNRVPCILTNSYDIFKIDRYHRYRPLVLNCLSLFSTHQSIFCLFLRTHTNWWNCSKPLTLFWNTEFKFRMQWIRFAINYRYLLEKCLSLTLERKSTETEWIADSR